MTLNIKENDENKKHYEKYKIEIGKEYKKKVEAYLKLKYG
jgi:hypothetical protein